MTEKMEYTALPVKEVPPAYTRERSEEPSKHGSAFWHRLLFLIGIFSVVGFISLTSGSFFFDTAPPRHGHKRPGFHHGGYMKHGCKGKPNFVSGESADYCPAMVKLSPSGDKLHNISFFTTDAYKNHSVSVLSKAVQVPTQSFDDIGGVGEDKRWEVFYDFENYLKQEFPLVFEKSKVEKVNTHGFVFTIEGSNSTLKPTLLAAHQDVVPVPEEGIDRWTYPPFSGFFDGEKVHGRGVSDDKNSLVGIMEAVDALLRQDFKPQRTLVLAFGFDEEISGYRGAGNISKFLKERYGDDSFFLLLDEGGAGIQDIYGQNFALLSTGEKGYVNVYITLTTSGGHSSIPPKHTAIGITSILVASIENHPYHPILTSKNPFYSLLQCVADASPAVPADLRDSIRTIESSKASQKKVFKTLDNTPFRYLYTTSQAVDIINGGLKVNALPETVKLTVNHRVAVDSTLDDVKNSISALTAKLAKRFALDVEAFGEVILSHGENSKGLFNLTAGEDALVPAPITPHIGNPTWNILGGTLRHVYEDIETAPYDSPLSVAPSIMTGNTDTRYYWDLTRNIYRFTPSRTGGSNIHAIDESLSIDEHIEAVAFYYELIRNLDDYLQE